MTVNPHFPYAPARPRPRPRLWPPAPVGLAITGIAIAGLAVPAPALFAILTTMIGGISPFDNSAAFWMAGLFGVGCAIHLSAALWRGLASARWAGIGFHLLILAANLRFLGDRQPGMSIFLACVGALGTAALTLPSMRRWAWIGERPIGRGAAWAAMIAGGLMFLSGAQGMSLIAPIPVPEVTWIQLVGGLVLVVAAYPLYRGFDVGWLGVLLVMPLQPLLYLGWGAYVGWGGVGGVSVWLGVLGDVAAGLYVLLILALGTPADRGSEALTTV